MCPLFRNNEEQNGITESYNETIMDEVGTALATAKMSWIYWPWAPANSTDKYNQLPHKSTGRSSHEIWYKEDKPKPTACTYLGR